MLTRLFVLCSALLALASCADPAPRVPQAAEEPPPADTALVTCLEDGIRIETPVVRAWRDGLHLRFDNLGGPAEYSLHHESSPYGTSSGGTLAKGISDAHSSIAPGRVLVACVPDPPGSYIDERALGDWIRVVDPDGLWVPSELACGWGTQFRIAIDAEARSDPFEVFRRVPGVLASDELIRPYYPESPLHGPTAIVFRDGAAVARIMNLGTEWELLVNACPGSGISKG